MDFTKINLNNIEAAAHQGKADPADTLVLVEAVRMLLAERHQLHNELDSAFDAREAFAS